MPLICLMIPFHFFICFILCYAFSLSCLPAKCFDICLLKTKKTQTIPNKFAIRVFCVPLLTIFANAYPLPIVAR